MFVCVCVSVSIWPIMGGCKYGDSFAHVIFTFFSLVPPLPHLLAMGSQYIVCNTENSSIFDVTDDGGTPLHFAAGKGKSALSNCMPFVVMITYADDSILMVWGPCRGGLYAHTECS